MALELLRIDPSTGEDTFSDPTYLGYAAAGSSDTDPVWSIKKKTVVSGVLQYQHPYITGTTMANTYPAIEANGVEYLQLSGLKWSDRTSYNYK